MSVTLLLITHDNIGSSILSTATNMMGVSPIVCHNLKITSQMDIEQGYELARAFCHTLGDNDELLIVTDIYGSTPSNIAAKLTEKRAPNKCLIVTGINLPMLVRIMNYAHLSLHDLAEKACSSASDSIFIVNQTTDSVAK
ncbi:PTS sugar transporter subunit IIA [sulfur-oxidizing endosymbiont of Gigantopelta aegis]|uniref:PTS sugar transporter subunit IIA n=1 Tax=sulfur-oxidizing endosymbiont of Gigantopelta aegis TaxID=2794934 RepID=UPI0018DDD607|nr:PTS fructose transporter subunit IIA [sulfur-oxidizing endosymbiont of Gigantopelta aegis]